MENINVFVSESYFNCECCGGSIDLNGKYLFNKEEFKFYKDGHLGSRYKGDDLIHNIHLNNSYSLFEATGEVLFNLLTLVCKKNNYEFLFYPLEYGKEKNYDELLLNIIDSEQAFYDKLDKDTKTFNEILLKNNLQKDEELCDNNFVMILKENRLILFNKINDSINNIQNYEISNLSFVLINILKNLGYNIVLNLKEEY